MVGRGNCCASDESTHSKPPQTCTNGRKDPTIKQHTDGKVKPDGLIKSSSVAFVVAYGISFVSGLSALDGLKCGAHAFEGVVIPKRSWTSAMW